MSEPVPDNNSNPPVLHETTAPTQSTDTLVQQHPDQFNNHTSQMTTSPPQAQQEQQSDSRYNSPTVHQQQQPTSRPDSGMGGVSQPYQDNTRPAQQNKSSVVIKVGMVGDAQIGKTSLMVKYVEGSWDEDYIQTLGIGAMRIHPWI